MTGTWHEPELAAVIAALGTDPAQGLTDAEAARRLAEHGFNALRERGGKSSWRILLDQLRGVMVLILIAAAVISALIGEYQDAIAIGVIVVLNALLGYSQEYRAERALAALKRLAVPVVRVRRSGRVHELPARELVPGDIVLLESGNLVPADGRLSEEHNLRIQESVLTGESEAVEKDARLPVEAGAALGDRRNMAYLGTLVTFGRGVLIVTATGDDTELGRIASALASVEREPTPLQKRLDQLARVLAVAALIIVSVIFAEGMLRGAGIRLMFLTAISMAVAAVPEGLPAVVTITLALGAQRMLRRQALIRKLPAVETLGSVTVICSDKTGTLTENRMTVQVLDVAGHELRVEEHLTRAEAALAPPASGPEPFAAAPALGLVLAGSALCNDAIPHRPAEGAGPIHAVGDPTETALVVAAARFGLWKESLEAVLPRVRELPFDSRRRRMTTVHDLRGGTARPAALAPLDLLGASQIAFTKGAVDVLLDIADRLWVGAGTEPMTADARARIAARNDQLAREGMRVLGVAVRALGPGAADETVEQEMVFVGMVAMIDPPRPEVRDAVRTCREAGIRPVMITGDHPLTALSIARSLGFETARARTGAELELLTVRELEPVVEETQVYARVSPEHKLKIVEALQDRHQVVAMTGDGVNDAPALKKADIGVAMGIAGTDVSKEAADMVLLDDNFATIVAAVREGRVIYDNIRKFIAYILSSNAGELIVMLLGPLLGMPLPLLPLQILFVNLVTDGLPGLALGVEHAEHDAMRRAPTPPGQSVLGGGVGRYIVLVGLLVGLLTVGTGYWYWRQGDPAWQTMVFTILTFVQMANVFAVRRTRVSSFRGGLFANRWLTGAVALTVALQLLVVYVPFLQPVFRTRSLNLLHLAVCVVVGGLVFAAVEIGKWIGRARKPS